MQQTISWNPEFYQNPESYRLPKKTKTFLLWTSEMPKTIQSKRRTVEETLYKSEWKIYMKFFGLCSFLSLSFSGLVARLS
jgi:hypothetical protein